MIDRSYLPFQSAQRLSRSRYAGSGWGFTSQNTPVRSVRKKNRVDFSTDLTQMSKLHLLSQLYVGQLKGCFVVKEKKQKTTIIGEVRELSPQTLSIRTNEGYRLIEVADILEIRLWEEEFMTRKELYETNCRWIIFQMTIFVLKRIFKNTLP